MSVNFCGADRGCQHETFIGLVRACSFPQMIGCMLRSPVAVAVSRLCHACSECRQHYPAHARNEESSRKTCKRHSSAIAMFVRASHAASTIRNKKRQWEGRRGSSRVVSPNTAPNTEVFECWLAWLRLALVWLVLSSIWVALGWECLHTTAFS